jgi:hypothetical protein
MRFKIEIRSDDIRSILLLPEGINKIHGCDESLIQPLSLQSNVHTKCALHFALRIREMIIRETAYNILKVVWRISQIHI